MRRLLAAILVLGTGLSSWSPAAGAEPSAAAPPLSRDKASNDTPQARWLRQAYRAMSSNWQLLVNSHKDELTPGFVRVRYSVSAQGGRPRVVVMERRTTANKVFADLCSRAVSETRFPAMPAEMIKALGTEVLEDEVTFKLY